MFFLSCCWRQRAHRPPRCCDCVAAFFQTCFFCLSAGGRGHYVTGLQGAVLPHFFKQFLFWLCFCWRRRHQWHQQLPRCCDCVAAFLLTCFFCLSSGGIKCCSRSMCIQGAVLVLLQFYSSTNNLFCLPAGGTINAIETQGAVLLHFFKHVLFWCFCWRSQAQQHRRKDRRCCVVAFLQRILFLCFCWRHHQALLPPTAPTPKLRQGKYFMTNGIGSVDHRLQDQPAKKQKVIKSKAGFKWRRVYKIVFKCVFSLTC